MYNDETVDHCPACAPNKKRKRGRRKNEIAEYRKAQVREKKATVNSYRRAEVSRYEREKGKQIYNKF